MNDKTKEALTAVTFELIKEHVKQEAIAFSAWCAYNLWTVHRDQWFRYRDEDNPISGEQLYELFLEEEKKRNAKP